MRVWYVSKFICMQSQEDRKRESKMLIVTAHLGIISHFTTHRFLFLPRSIATPLSGLWDSGSRDFLALILNIRRKIRLEYLAPSSSRKPRLQRKDAPPLPV